MSTVKLSKTQQELFDAMLSGVTVTFSPYMGRFNPTAYYYRDDNNKRVTAAARGLLEKGLIEKANRTVSGSHELRIKPTSREA